MTKADNNMIIFKYLVPVLAYPHDEPMFLDEQLWYETHHVGKQWLPKISRPKLQLCLKTSWHKMISTYSNNDRIIFHAFIMLLVKKLDPFIFSTTEKHLKPISRNFSDQNMLFCNLGNFTCFYVDPLAATLWPMIGCCVCYFKRTNNSPTYFLPQAFSKCYFSKEKASTLSVVN